MGTLVTPEYVRELATFLDVKDATEWALPYAVASAPLPDGWTCLIADNGSVTFVNEARPQSPQREHPLLDRAAQALAKLRASTGSASRGGTALRLLGPFENLESPAVELFYLDVESGEQVPAFNCPPGSLVPPLPDEIARILTTAGSESDFESGLGTSATNPEDLPEDEGPQQQQSLPASPAPAEQLYGDEPGAAPDQEMTGELQGGHLDTEDEVAPATAIGNTSARASGSGSRPGSAVRQQSSRPPSASPSMPSRHSGAGGAAAGAGSGGSAAGSPRPPASPSASVPALKALSREGSARGSGSSRLLGTTGGDVVAASPSPSGNPAVRSSSRSSSLNRDARRASQTSIIGPEPSRGSVAGSDAGGRRSRPASSSSSPVPAAPAPSPPAPPAVTIASSAVVSRSSSGVGCDDDGESARAMFRRDISTTAGYAGSISEHSSALGTRKGGGGSAKSIGSAPGGGGSGGVSGGGGSRSGGEPMSRSSSALSGTSAASGSGSASTSASGGSGSGSSGGSGAGGSSSGRSGAAGAGTMGGVGTLPPVPPPSGRLTFYGWWFEDVESSDLTFRITTNPTAGGGLAARHCALLYDFASGTYSLTLRDPVTPPAPGQPYTRIPELTVPGLAGDQVAMVDTGRPAGVWDLHLGARLRVLGKQVVLKNSDLASAQWHAGYYRQLCALRDKLTQEVQKYKPRVLRPGLVTDKGDVRLRTGQQLRHVALQVRELIEDLGQYRPSKAESFLAALPIQF